MVRMLLLCTVFLGWFAIVTFSAPVEQLIPAASVSALPTRQVLLLSPEAQLQLTPSFKLQTPIFQSVTPIGRIQNANDQTIILYPSSALPDGPGDQEMWFNQIIQIIQMWGSSGPGAIIGGGGGGGGGDKGDGDNGDGSSFVFISSQGSKENSNQTPTPEKIELNPEAESIPQGGLTPASTVHLTPNNRKFYTIAGAPQFFGNFDFLQNPANPIFSLQPLEAIKARSMIDSAKGVDIEKESAALRSLPAYYNSLQSALPLKPAESSPTALPVRFGGSQLTDNIDPGYQPGVAATHFAQFLVQQKVLQPENTINENQKGAGVAAQEFVQLLGQQQQTIPGNSNLALKTTEIEAPEEITPTRISDDASIAQARPVAIAITGKGGLAQSAPIGTAIVGEDGFALSSPSATAIAGDFSIDELSASGVRESEQNKLRKQ